MEPKKISLEGLSKEELLQRYKNLLTIAQKAKAAKDGKIYKNLYCSSHFIHHGKIFRRLVQ